MFRGSVGRVVLGAALTASVVGAAPPITGAAVGQPDTLVVLSRTDVTLAFRADDVAGVSFGDGIPVTSFAVEGNFSGAPGTDVLVYGPGSAPDGIIHVDGASISRRDLTVRGTYTPVVGDFDGNGIDDVLWYGRGAIVERMWLFNANGSYTEGSGYGAHRSDYQPIVLDANGDGRDDIVWYAPGPGYDSIWLMGPGAIPEFRTVPPISGTYQPIVGRFGPVPEGSAPERILWSRPGGPSPLWTFGPNAQVTSQSVAVGRPGRAIVADVTGSGTDSIFWYTPGSTAERLTSFASGPGGVTATEVAARAVDGSYTPGVGDFDGDGRDDIAWAGPGRTTLWFMNGPRPSSQSTFDTGIAQPVPFRAIPG